MQNLYFKQYTQDILNLSRSMVIKFSPIANQINRELEVEGYLVDYNDPKTWKYYLNLSGKRHESDKKMYVKSSDTLETIEFTSENLKLHLATLREFYPGSFQYNNLVREFPEQESLIRGILYPIDLNKAIESEDGTILYYDKSLIEGNEDDLINNIQDWINVFMFRWFNKAYGLLDDFNSIAFLGNMYRSLPLAIMNLRLRNCNTNKAHSYYVKEYLASHDRLDDYFEYLNLYQRLWLYRNIRYIKRNSGKTDTFKRLTENILTIRGIPLISYDLVQDNKDLILNEKTDVKLLKNELNFDYGNELNPDDNYEELEYIFAREVYLARDNQKVMPYDLKDLKSNFSSSAYSHLPTKVLDSEVVDRSNSNVRNITNFLMTQWAWLASTGRYKAYTTVTNPRSGEFMILNVKDVFILMIYCYLKYHDKEPEYVPSFYVYEALRNPLPSFNELRQLAPRTHIKDDVIVEYQKLFIPMNAYISTEQFYLDGREAHRNYLKQWEAYSFQEHKDSRSYAENIFKRHYINFKCNLVDKPTTYFEFFKDNGIDISNLASHELAQMATDCFIRATGSDLFREITISEIQKALLGLMDRLSSYPLQFLHNTDSTNFHVLGSNVVRVGDVDYGAIGHYRGNFVNIDVLHVDTEAEHDIVLSDAIITPEQRYDYDMELCTKIDPIVNVIDLTHRYATYGFNVDNVGVNQVSFTVPIINGDNYLDNYED